MRAPSNRSGISGTLLGASLATILFAGFALGPKAFEFKAWPEPARNYSVEDVVARSSDEVTEVPIVRVRRSERPRRGDAVGVRGRNSGGHGSPRGDLNVRSDRPADRASRGRPADPHTPSAPEPTAPIDVVEMPAPAEPTAPVPEPDTPAQLAEVAVPAPVLRLEAEEFAMESRTEPRGEADLESDGLFDEAGRLIDSLLPGDDRFDGSGRRHRNR